MGDSLFPDVTLLLLSNSFENRAYDRSPVEQSETGVDAGSFYLQFSGGWLQSEYLGGTFFCIETVVRLWDFASPQVIWTTYDYSTDRLSLELIDAEALHVKINGTSVISGVVDIDSGGPEYNVVVERGEDSMLRLWFDGTLVGSAYDSSSSTFDHYYVRFGADHEGNNPFMDRMYQARVTEAERYGTTTTPVAGVPEYFEYYAEIYGVLYEADGTTPMTGVRTALYSREEGQLLDWEPTSWLGEIFLYTPIPGELQVVIHSPTTEAPLQNDLIFRILVE